MRIALLAGAALLAISGCGSSFGHALPTTTSTVPSGATGVSGRVTAGPTCPVERADQPCPPRPLARTRIDALAHDQVAGSAVTDQDGRYAIALRPGDYTLHLITTSSLPRCPDTAVTVTSGPSTTIDVACDTGIR